MTQVAEFVDDLLNHVAGRNVQRRPPEEAADVTTATASETVVPGWSVRASEQTRSFPFPRPPFVAMLAERRPGEKTDGAVPPCATRRPGCTRQSGHCRLSLAIRRFTAPPPSVRPSVVRAVRRRRSPLSDLVPIVASAGPSVAASRR
uniref:Uncharacterized protein n=1 Tax=Plectus sambesii TaxID=2011161 RepID=A0A914WW77_9BILA